MDPEDQVEDDEQARVHDQVGTSTDPKQVRDKGCRVWEDNDKSGADPHQGPQEADGRAQAPLFVGVDSFCQGNQDKREQEELAGFHTVNLRTLARMSLM